MTITKEVLDELLSGVENADDLLGDQGLMKELKVRLMERMLGAELTEHLGYEPGADPTMHWHAPIGWSGLIVSASWASGPPERCFLGQAGGSPERCAA